ncbi:MAG: FG-GAP repeat protein [Myxococcales bacterium]|nr:MAG: FG-GAP repeat protein [Myxococcales bacterium]
MGYSIAIDGDWLIAGAPGRSDGSATSGAVYLYRWNGSSWDFFNRYFGSLSNSDNHEFGSSVSIQGTRFVVGDVGPNNSAGYAYIFDWNGSTWQETAALQPSDGSNDDEFGKDVKLYGDFAIIGAPYNTTNTGGLGAGYLYVRQPNNNWALAIKYEASDYYGADALGYTVYIDSSQVYLFANWKFNTASYDDVGALYIVDLP